MAYMKVTFLSKIDHNFEIIKKKDTGTFRVGHLEHWSFRAGRSTCLFLSSEDIKPSVKIPSKKNYITFVFSTVQSKFNFGYNALYKCKYCILNLLIR